MCVSISLQVKPILEDMKVPLTLHEIITRNFTTHCRNNIYVINSCFPSKLTPSNYHVFYHLQKKESQWKNS